MDIHISFEFLSEWPRAGYAFVKEMDRYAWLTTYVVLSFLINAILVRKFVQANLARPNNGGWGYGDAPPLALMSGGVWLLSPITMPFMLLGRYWFGGF